MLEFFYYIQSLYCKLFIFQFSCTTISIRDRFNMLHTKDIRQKSEIYLVLEGYEKIFQCVELINENLTFQLISVFGFILVIATFEFYSIISISNQESAMIEKMIPSMVWICLYLYYCILAIYPASSAASCFEKINSIEDKILKSIKYIDQDSYQYFQAYLRHIRGHKWKFESIFFDIDWRLLFGVSLLMVFNYPFLLETCFSIYCDFVSAILVIYIYKNGT